MALAVVEGAQLEENDRFSDQRFVAAARDIQAEFGDVPLGTGES